MFVNQKIITRLTTLWALSESGLGGFMHALKIPFTGFFLGGFAIVIITLIAHFSSNRFQSITQATLLVILIKASVSPHSPPPAYIAVAFQGLCGAIVYGLLSVNRFSAALFGMFALFESAVQKFLVLTLIYGKNIWDAIDLFFNGIIKDLPFLHQFSFSFFIIAAYTLVYSIWGICVGVWASLLPQKIQLKTIVILEKYNQIIIGNETAANNIKSKKYKKWIGVFFMLLFICSVFLLTGEKGLAFYAIIRTLAAILLLFFVLNPIIKWLMAKWVEKKKQEKASAIIEIMDLIPAFKNLLNPAMQMARYETKGLRVYSGFVLNLIVLALFAETKQEQKHE